MMRISSTKKRTKQNKNRRKRRNKELLVVRKKGNKFIGLGESFFDGDDIYHFLLTISWWKFIGLISGIYVVLNIIFACGYLLKQDSIAYANSQSFSFIDAFAFSVQTMATIGYGAMYPQTTYGHILVSIEVLVGLLLIAMATSLMFARFSRPTAKMMFSDVAVICNYDGVPTLTFRLANMRNNWIVEAQVRVSLLLPQTETKEGYQMRRLYDLPLVRNESPFVALTWAVMHPITEDSPLYGLTEEMFLDGDYQLFISLTGLDATLSQTIHSRHIYLSEDVLWHYHFVDIVQATPDGSLYIEDHKFHDVFPVDE